MKRILGWLDLPTLAIIALFLGLLTFQVIVDPDYYWHVITGQYIWQHGLPANDIFSWTASGKPWVLHEWLFEVALYGAWELLGGETGTRILVALLATGTLAVMYGGARRLTGRAYPALFLALACFGLMFPGLTPRPQLVTYLLLAVYLRILLDFKYGGSLRPLLALPVLMVVWVNSHGGFAVGLAVLFFFAGCETLRWLVAAPRDAQQALRLKRLGLAAVATLLASLANPWFADHWAYPFAVVDMEASRSFISEWRSPDFHDPVNKAWLLAAGGFLLLTVYRRDKPDLTEIATPMVFLLMGCISIRHMPLACIAMCLFGAVALSRQPLAAMVPASWQDRARRTWQARAAGSKELGDTEFVFNGILLALLVAATFAWYPVQQPLNALKAKKFVPVDAVDFIVNQRIEGRVFNTYHFGGYLIYRLYPAQGVYIDGRADMYGDAAVKAYADLADGKPGWSESFDRLAIDYALLQRGQALRQLLLARGDWRLVYDDDYNSVLVRGNGPWGRLPLTDARTATTRDEP